MKQFLLMAASGLWLLPSHMVHAQAPTTPAEYELVTHGLAAERAAGHALPPKGYQLTAAAVYNAGQFTISLEELRRESSRELAAIVIQMKHPNWTAPRYLCLPNATSELALQQRYLTEVTALTPGNTNALTTALALRLTALSSAPR